MATTIFDRIKSKKDGWNATNVMLTFIKSAIESNKRCNNLTEIMFSPALKAAMDLDEEFEKTGELRGPRKFEISLENVWRTSLARCRELRFCRELRSFSRVFLYSPRSARLIQGSNRYRECRQHNGVHTPNEQALNSRRNTRFNRSTIRWHSHLQDKRATNDVIIRMFQPLVRHDPEPLRPTSNSRWIFRW